MVLRQSQNFQTSTGLLCSLVQVLGIGLLFYGVAEPIMHLSSDVIHKEDALFADKANLAMNLTYLHWGFHGWGIYGVVGLCFAYFTFNKNLPFRVSSFFSGTYSKNAGESFIGCYCYYCNYFWYCDILGSWCKSD